MNLSAPCPAAVRVNAGSRHASWNRHTRLVLRPRRSPPVACSPGDEKSNTSDQLDASKLSASQLLEAEEALLPGKVCQCVCTP